MYLEVSTDEEFPDKVCSCLTSVHKVVIYAISRQSSQIAVVAVVGKPVVYSQEYRPAGNINR